MRSSLLMFLIVNACVSSGDSEIDDIARKTVIKATMPVLEKIFVAQVPIKPSSYSRFPVVKSLRGPKFNPTFDWKNRVSITTDGKFRFTKGDYIIPVMTYCMKSSASSPNAHLYTLSKLTGKSADIIRDLHQRSFGLFATSDIQIASWSIQNGVPFESMSERTKSIISTTIPEHKERLSKGFLETFEEEWDRLAQLTPRLPKFNQLTDTALNELGEIGTYIREARRFRQDIIRYGHDYSMLSRSISTPGLSDQQGTPASTPWSMIEPGVYARFITSGHFTNFGQLQIRVENLQASVTLSPQKYSFTEEATDRKKAHANLTLIAQTGMAAGEVDPSALQADPGSGSIQPLGFSGPLLGAGVTIGTLSNPPGWVVAGIFAAAIVASNWSAISEGIEKWITSSDPEVKKEVEKAQTAMNERHDQLEGTIKDAGILNDAEVSRPEGAGKPSRIYEKEGGKSKMDRDFDRVPGQETSPEPGVRVKTQPNGDKVVARDRSSGDNSPTIEVQPKDSSGKERVKIRYRF